MLADKGEGGIGLHVHPKPGLVDPSRLARSPIERIVRVVAFAFALVVEIKSLSRREEGQDIFRGQLLDPVFLHPFSGDLIGLEVPFADHRAGVACRAEALGNCHRVKGKRHVRDLVDSQPLLVAAGQEPCPRGATLRGGDVAGRASNSLFRHRIQVGRPNVLHSSLDTQVSVAQIIGDNDDDIWRSRGCRHRAADEEQQNEEAQGAGVEDGGKSMGFFHGDFSLLGGTSFPPHIIGIGHG